MVRFLSLLSSAAVFLLSFAIPARSEPPNRTEITALLFTPDGKTLISTSLDGALRIWDPATGEERAKVQAHKEGVYGASLSADGKLLATAGGDKLARLWDVAKIKELQTFTGHNKEVVCVALSPDGKFVATGSHDKTIRLWDATDGKEMHVLKGPTHKITSLGFSPEGKTLASAGIVPAETGGFRGSTQGDQVRLWDVNKGEKLSTLEQRGHRVIYSGGEGVLAAGGMYLDFPPAPGGGVHIDGGSRIVVWEPERKKERIKIEEYGTAFALSPDGKFLATGWGTRLHMGGIVTKEDKGNGIHLWEIATGKEILRFQTPEDAAAVLAFSPDGRKVVAGRINGKINFWDLAPKDWKADTVKNLDTKDLVKRWEALTGDDPVAAYEAIWDLSAAEDKAVELFKERIHPVEAGSAKVRKLIANLDDADITVREAADKELASLGADVEPDLRKALEAQPSEEVHRRIKALLDSLDQARLPLAMLRQCRTVLVLERIGSKNAREILQTLAKGASSAWLTQEATRGTGPPSSTDRKANALTGLCDRWPYRDAAVGGSAIHRRTWIVCGRYVVKTPIKTIAKMHRVFDAPLFEPRYNVARTRAPPTTPIRDKSASRPLARTDVAEQDLRRVAHCGCIHPCCLAHFGLT